jgi:ParB-like chromosome segregation protein Spo0J
VKLKDRIKELRRVPASELVPNPKNWRTHPEAQRNALLGVLAEVGIADAVLARELEDGSLMLIDGHLRAETSGDTKLPVLVLDVNEAEADKILATLDPLSAMASTDKVKLDEILRDIDTSSVAVQEMLADLAKDAGLYGTEEADDDVATTDEPEVGFSIGEVRFKVDKEAYDQWLEDIRQEVGFDEDSLVAEFKRRLALPS